MALSYEAVKRCLFDEANFNGRLYDDFNTRNEGEESEFLALPLLEGAPHRRLRTLVGQGLNPRSIKVWEDRMIRPVVLELLDDCPRGEPVDLARSFCRPLPGAAIGAVLGLLARDLPAFNTLGFLAFTGPVFDEGKKAEKLLADYFGVQIAYRHSLPDEQLARREDVISLMVKARIGEDRMSAEEIIPSLFFFLFAGGDTTYLTLCNIAYYLVEQDGLWERLKADRSKIPDVIEETLRLHPPGPVLARNTKNDTEVCGHKIKAGTPIAINVLMANHDPAAWSDPDRFTFGRPRERPHLSFGFGPHICPGMHLARLEMTVALNEILDRYDGIEWDPTHGRPSFVGIGSRGVSHTHVILR